MKHIKSVISPYKKHFVQWFAMRNEQIRLYNLPLLWFQQFLEQRIGVSRITSKKIALIHCGHRKSFELCSEPIKFFFTGENVHVPYSVWNECEDLFLNDKSLSLSLGFDYIEHEKYMRFPFWLVAHFSPIATYEEVKSWCEKVNNPADIDKRSGCSFICRQDYFGDRAYLANMLNEVLPIKFPSKFNHNDDSLITNFADDKIAYLNQFKFNLCPENSSVHGYVTEKIFDALLAGCIPIYWGNGEHNPEKNIINSASVIFLKHITLDRDLYDFDTQTISQPSNADAISLIKLLNENSKAYKEFMAIPRLEKDAADVIFNYFILLENKLKEILQL